MHNGRATGQQLQTQSSLFLVLALLFPLFHTCREPDTAAGAPKMMSRVIKKLFEAP